MSIKPRDDDFRREEIDSLIRHQQELRILTDINKRVGEQIDAQAQEIKTLREEVEKLRVLGICVRGLMKLMNEGRANTPLVDAWQIVKGPEALGWKS
jgi:hypothetical protein